MKATSEHIQTALARLPGWAVVGAEGHEALSKICHFENFHQTMAFVNAAAALAHRLNHHPELWVNFAQCRIQWRTHDAQAITQLDIEAATQTQALLS